MIEDTSLKKCCNYGILELNYRYFHKIVQSSPTKEQRWKPVGSTGTGRVDRPVGLPIGSIFFDRPVKPVEKPVKLSFRQLKDI